MSKFFVEESRVSDAHEARKPFLSFIRATADTAAPLMKEQFANAMLRVTAYLSGGNTIGSGFCDAGHGLLYFAVISPITFSQRPFPNAL